MASREPELDRLVAIGLDDLRALLLADPAAPADRFAGAGTPWYFTLFGRDSLWAARFALPLGTDLALGTLRTLARRQGTRDDPETAEAPGKILHEIRQLPAGVERAAGPAAVLLRHDRRHAAVDQPAARRVALGLPRRPPSSRCWTPMRRALDWVLRHDGFLPMWTSPAAAWPTRAGRTRRTPFRTVPAGSPRRRSC